MAAPGRRYNLPDPASAFFRGQTVFLTGATGGLGGCLLYKLALELGAVKIYALVRGSPARARAQWDETMPAQIARILATGRVQLVVGDVTAPALGLATDVLAELAACVTVVIHSAGNTSLASGGLGASVRDNCLPALELAHLAAEFRHLVRFVHVSTAYVNSFLPDGCVEERIYDVGGDAEAQLCEILDTGSLAPDAMMPEFPWPYAFAKHLAERLLLARYPRLPTLIVHPTLVGPAVARPYPHYGPHGANPISTFLRAYLANPDSGTVRAPAGGANVLDEVPVDVVANAILLHAMWGRARIVHAGAHL
ncbi:male sterility protein-domain-containing protein, partial [Mycena epipterygia]